MPDERLDWLAQLHNPKKLTPAVVEFVDIAGLVKGASKGEGLGNKFLSNIRTTDAIVHVVRCFEDSNVTHVEGTTDPLRDIEIINLELVMADIEMVERRIDKAQKAMKGGDKKFAREVELFTELLAHLNAGKLARTFTDDADDLALIATSDLLTLKKTIYVANLSENEINEPDDLNAGKLARTFTDDADDLALIATSDLLTLKKTIYVANLSENEINEPDGNRHYQAVKALAQEEGSQCLPICAKLEADIAELDDPEEKAMFMEELGVAESGLDRLIKASYALLGLISFLTAGSDECRELDDPEEKAMFMEELGVAESGLDRLIKASYALLGLISFLTAGSDECRAWTIKQGTKAPQAAGKIHTDFERGFIRAEVIAFEDMKACGTMAAAKAKGLVRSEGKEYVMKDGDIVNFLFNV